jgi:hypothetical protein
MAYPTAEWTKVLVHPLGLVGYALFLLFGLVARAKRRDERRWLLPAVLTAAAAALFGGLGLAYRDVDHKDQETVHGSSTPTPTPTPSPLQVKQKIGLVKQHSSGACSPNVVTAGSVTVTCSEANARPKEQPAHDNKRTGQPR